MVRRDRLPAAHRFRRSVLDADVRSSASYLITGLRLSSAIGLTKKHVDLENQRVYVKLKSRKPGGRWQWLPISKEACAILNTEMKRSTTPAVWTYELQRGEEKGERRPITASGFRRVFDGTLVAAGIDNFRRHDLRHDFASKLLRATRDLALVQKAMTHTDISSTLVYAHVLDEDVRAGLDMLSRNSPGAADVSSGEKRKKA